MSDDEPPEAAARAGRHHPDGALRRPYQVDPPPWPVPVDMAPPLSELCTEFRSYVILPPHTDVVSSLWTVGTYCRQFGLTEYAPRLIIKSPERMSGKSRLLRLFGISRQPAV